MNVSKGPYVVIGGCLLAFGASFANVSLMMRTGTSVSHLTGDIMRMTINLAKWSPAMLSDFTRVSVAAAGFLLGAILAGAVIHHPTLDFSRPYGRTVTGIGLLFLTSYLLILSYPVASIALTAFGCGLQNALASRYRGVILRTTHLTGMFTDFGATLGMKLRGYEIPAWKIAIPFLLISSFFLGGLCSASLEFLGFDAIAFAAGGYILVGISWSILKRVVIAGSPAD